MDAEYTKLERDFKTLTDNFIRSQLTPASQTQRKAAYERFMSRLRILNYAAIEQRHPVPFIFWLIEKNKTKGLQVLFEIFKMLHLIDYSFAKKTPDKLCLVSYLSKLPEAIPLLKFFFDKFPKKILLNQLDPFHPLCNSELNDELFVLLYQNFANYNQPHVTPMNVAVMQKNHALIDKIHRLFPSAINEYSSEGVNPLSQAIYTRCEATLDKVLSLNPDIDFTNRYGATLGHMACQVEDDQAFLHRLVFDEKYAVLNLREKICSHISRNIYEQLPLFITLIRGHYEIFEFILGEIPRLKEEFYHMTLNLIDLKDHSGLNYLATRHNFSPDSNPKFFLAFTNRFFLTKQFHILDWLCSIDTIDPNNQKVFCLIKAIIEKNEAKIREYLSDESVPWSALLPILSWKVTEQLIENNYCHFISEYQLFDRNIFFMVNTSGEFQDNFTNFIPLPTDHSFPFDQKIDKKYQPLIEYFCDYVNRHQDRYPQSIEHFVDPCIFVLTYIHDYNIRLNGLPLLHYFESFLFMNVGRIEYLKNKPAPVSKESIFEQMMSFYGRHISIIVNDPTVDFNVKDASGLHIFAKLIQENHLIRITYLKEKQPEMTLDDLDPKGSNLLHLACENDYIDTIKWCIQAEINPVLARASDHLLPIEIAFEKHNMQIFNYLRKLVKPSTFLSVLNQLIQNGNDALLEYLVANGFFGFKLSPYHKESIKKLQNQILNRFIASLDRDGAAAAVVEESLNMAERVTLPEPSPVMVASSAKKTSINQGYLNTYRHLLTAKSLENLVGTTKQLKQDVYQEPLRVILGSNILAYVRKILSSGNQGLLKHFFRIPVVLELMVDDDNWFKFAIIGIDSNSIELIDLILGQVDVRAQFETRIVELLKAASQKPAIFSFLKQQYALDIHAMQDLIQFSIEADNQDALNALLTTNFLDYIHQLLITYDINVLRQFLTIPLVLEMMTEKDHWFQLASLAIELDRQDLLQLTLAQDGVKAQLQSKTVTLLNATMIKPELFGLFATALELSPEDIKHLIGNSIESGIHAPLVALLRPRILEHIQQMLLASDVEVLMQFIRTPIVLELMGVDDNWFKLTNSIILLNKADLLTLVLEQFDFRGREIEFFKTACPQAASLSHLMSKLELKADTLETLIQYAVEEDYPEVLLYLLKHQHAEAVIQANAMLLLMSSFDENNDILDFLLGKEYLHDMLGEKLYFFIKLAIFNEKPEIIEKLLMIEKLRNKFIETGYSFVQELLAKKQTHLIPWFIKHSDLISFLSQFSELQLHICKRERHAQTELTMFGPQVIPIGDFFEAVSKNNLSLLSELLQVSKRELIPPVLMQLINCAISVQNIEAFKLLNAFSNHYFLNDQMTLKNLLITSIRQQNLGMFSYLISNAPAEKLSAAIDHDVFTASTCNYHPAIIMNLISIPQYAYRSAGHNHLLLKLAIKHHDLDLIQQILQLHHVKVSLFEHRQVLVNEAFKSRNQSVLFQVLLNHVLFTSFFEHPRTSIEMLCHFTRFFLEAHQTSLIKDDLHIVNLLKKKHELEGFHPELDTLKNRFFPPKERSQGASAAYAAAGHITTPKPKKK